jgi:hypothetical protein
VHLVDVDRVEPQALEAELDFTQDRVAFEHVAYAAVAAVLQAGLGEHVRSRPQALERAADDLFGMAEPVDRGRVEPVDAELHRPLDRGDRQLVVLRTPGIPPAAAADRPGAQSDARYPQAGARELDRRERHPRTTAGRSGARPGSGRASR